MSRKLLGTSLLLILFCAALWAQTKEPEISVKAEVNKAFITIGDPVEYTVTVRHTPSIQILSTVPPPPDNLFKIKKVEDIKRKEGEQIVEGRKFTLTAFALGEFILDPVEIEYRVGDGATQKLSTDKIFISVKSVAKGEQKMDIRGIKSVMAIAAHYLGIILLTLFVCLAALGGWLYYLAKQKQAGATETPKIILSPEEEALNQLNQLFDSALLRSGKIKEYYLRLSEILRLYFEKRFQILAVESTTDEIVSALRKQEIDRELREKISQVLEAADLAKFAKWKPEPPQIIQLNLQSKQIIEMARPKAEVPGGI